MREDDFEKQRKGKWLDHRTGLIASVKEHKGEFKLRVRAGERGSNVLMCSLTKENIEELAGGEIATSSAIFSLIEKAASDYDELKPYFSEYNQH